MRDENKKKSRRNELEYTSLEEKNIADKERTTTVKLFLGWMDGR
jgi:hypothetical protein